MRLKSPWLALPLFAAVVPAVAAFALRPDEGGRKGPGTPPASARRGLTFARDVAPMIYKNCSTCHRPGEVAPFSLLSYQDVKKRAKQIGLVTETRFMPPWKAQPGFGEFKDARYLTTDQIDTIKQWVAEGAPEGRAADEPPAPKFTAGWTLGKPDAEFDAGAEFSLDAEGRDVYRCFVLPTNYSEDRYISAMEVRPGNRKVVHHVIAFLDSSGAARKLDEKDPGPGYTSFGGIGFAPSGALGGWAPGNMPRLLPAGVGTLLPKGADIVMQVHYHKSGKAETDRTKIAVYFAKGPVDKRLRVMPVVNPFLNIQPGESSHEVRALMSVPADATVLQVTPHMHLLGREMTVVANLPDGTVKPLVKIPDWDFNWQTTYELKDPMKLPKGSTISLVAKYDNSDGNPRQPSKPPKPVHWGEQTTDEMCIAFIGYIADSEQLTKGISANGLPDWGSLGGRRRAILRNLRN